MNEKGPFLLFDITPNFLQKQAKYWRVMSSQDQYLSTSFTHGLSIKNSPSHTNKGKGSWSRICQAFSGTIFPRHMFPPKPLCAALEISRVTGILRNTFVSRVLWLAALLMLVSYFSRELDMRNSRSLPLDILVEDMNLSEDFSCISTTTTVKLKVKIWVVEVMHVAQLERRFLCSPRSFLLPFVNISASNPNLVTRRRSWALWKFDLKCKYCNLRPPQTAEFLEAADTQTRIFAKKIDFAQSFEL